MKKLLVILSILFIFPSQTFAISANDRGHVNRDTTQHDESDICGVSGSEESDGPLVGGTDAEKVFNYLRMKGLTAAQSAGIVGNFMQETGGRTEDLNPSLVGEYNGHTYNGIAQWSDEFGAAQRLKAYAKKKNLPWDDLKAQLDFLWYDMTKGAELTTLPALKRTNDPQAAAVVFENKYERSGGSQLDARKSMAQDIYNKYKDNPVPSGTPAGNETNPGGGGQPADSQPAATGSVDIKDIVQKYSLHSAIILSKNGDVIASENASDAPKSPASTLKLVIADTVLKENIGLDRNINVTNDILYDGTNDFSSPHTVSNAMTQALSQSHNVAANAMMKSLGGPRDFTSKARDAGYTGTDVKAYYSSAAMGQNKSTVKDQATAMANIFKGNDQGNRIAQDALKQGAAAGNNHYSVPSYANKWGGNSLVASNVGLFKVGGSEYIIGLYYEGNFGSSDAINAIKNGTKDLIEAAKKAGGEIDGSGACGGDINTGSGDGQAIVDMALKLAWKDGSHGTTPRQAYVTAMNKFNKPGYDLTGGKGTDCGVFVSTVVRASGADKDFPVSGTPIIEKYFRDNRDKYDIVERVKDKSELRPGDILVVNSGDGFGGKGHIYIYVGKQNNGFDAASASYLTRSANLTNASLADSRGNYLRARLK